MPSYEARLSEKSMKKRSVHEVHEHLAENPPWFAALWGAIKATKICNPADFLKRFFAQDCP
jgi:hypothetical protein